MMMLRVIDVDEYGHVTERYPTGRQDVTVKSAPAVAVMNLRQRVMTGQEELMAVRDEYDAGKALEDENNWQHCPLCNDVFPTRAFVAHAADCIRARAPRHKVWTPPGMLTDALAVFPEKRIGP